MTTGFLSLFFILSPNLGSWQWLSCSCSANLELLCLILRASNNLVQSILSVTFLLIFWGKIFAPPERSIYHLLHGGSGSLGAKLCPTLCDPTDCSLPGSSVHGISRQKYWSESLLPSPKDLPDPGTEPTSPAWQADSSPLSHLGGHYSSTGHYYSYQCPSLTWRGKLSLLVSSLQ